MDVFPLTQVGSLILLLDSDILEEASSQDTEVVAELGYEGSDLLDYLRTRADSFSFLPSDSTSASSVLGSPSSTDYMACSPCFSSSD